MQVTNIFKNDPTFANRYLADQLSETEIAAFEAQLIADPKVARELEATARFKQALRQLRAKGQLAGLIDAPPKWRIPKSFAAAAAILVLLVGVLVMRWDRSPPILVASLPSLVDQQGSTLPIAKTFTMVRMRSAGYDAVIDLPASRQAIALRIFPAATAHPARYRASLMRVMENGDRTSVASIDDLSRANDGAVTLYADSSQLAPGNYRIVIASDAPDAVGDETFAIKVRSGLESQ